MKASILLFLWLSFLFHTSSCSRNVEVNNVSTPDLKPVDTIVVNSEVAAQNTPVQTVESKSPSNPLDKVLFDGKNYIKKSGWKTPPKKDSYIDESYDQGSVEARTEKGKQVRTKTLLYDYRTSWWHSQDFYYEGRDIDYLKGKLESLSFMETSVNGKVFMYSITVGPLILNELDHRDPFGYQIQDRDGDGIFETLLWDDADIVVPNWVLS
jgi:hypothetical protein